MLSTWLPDIVHSVSILATTPWHLPFSCTMGGVSSHIEAVWTIVDWMRTILEEAQVNLAIAQSRFKSQVVALAYFVLY